MARGGMLGHAPRARMLRHAASAHAWGARVTGDACWGMLQAPARGARGALMTGLLPHKKETKNRLLLRLFVFEVPCLMCFIVF